METAASGEPENQNVLLVESEVLEDRNVKVLNSNQSPHTDQELCSKDEDLDKYEVSQVRNSKKVVEHTEDLEKLQLSSIENGGNNLQVTSVPEQPVALVHHSNLSSQTNEELPVQTVYSDSSATNNDSGFVQVQTPTEGHSTSTSPSKLSTLEEIGIPTEVRGMTPSLQSSSLTPQKNSSPSVVSASPTQKQASQVPPSHSAPTSSATSTQAQSSSPIPSPTPPVTPEKYNQLQQQLKAYESQIEQMKVALSQKDNTITLYQRENTLLEKEKLAFRKEKELATKEKESIVITFATKEKSLIDVKKQKETVEKQLADSRKEVKNISMKFHTLNEEKSRITHMLDEKCNEVKKLQREFEKQKTEYGNLEMKLKWNSVKLAQETEGKLVAEKKLEEERNAPRPHEEKANEKLKMEYEATTILLKHEIDKKDKAIENLTKENKQTAEKVTQLQDAISKEILENTRLNRELECIRQEHVVVQNSYSEEMLNSAKLRGQLEELQVLRAQHTINEDKINTLNETIEELEEKARDSAQDLEQLHAKQEELLSINLEMSQLIVGLQNEICLQKSKIQGVEAENEILKKEKLDFDTKYNEIDSQLKQEIQQKTDERQLLTKHLSEKTKMYESVKLKLDNAQGDLEATKKKHSQVVKELHRELQKYKKFYDENTSSSSPTSLGFCKNCQLKGTPVERRTSSNSRGSNSRSDSESEAQSTSSTMNRDVQGPSKQHLVERILRLQQASARQTEKIDFLENHTLSLVSELQKKSKVVQYYMMRDQAGALTSSKSDQNKSELVKYGGVMSAIYSGIKGPNQSMTLELSLEINKKLQAVLEDTLLKNITLKENLDVLGLEVDKLTRKLAQLAS